MKIHFIRQKADRRFISKVKLKIRKRKLEEKKVTSIQNYHNLVLFNLISRDYFDAFDRTICRCL